MQFSILHCSIICFTILNFLVQEKICIENLYGILDEDHTILVNQSIKLQCRLREKHEDPYFIFKKNTRLNATVVNSTFIEYHKKFATYEDEGGYTCFPEDSTQTTIKIGCKPPPIKNYSCVLLELDYVECDFLLENNCPRDHVIVSEDIIQCVINEDKKEMKPVINRQENKVQCRLKNPPLTSNLFLNVSTKFDDPVGDYDEHWTISLDHSLMKPKQPKLRISNVTTNTMLLSWETSIAKIVNNIIPLIFEISYKSEFDEHKPITISSTSITRNELQLSNLRPFTSYNVSIRCRLEKNNNIWSEYVTKQTERTKQSVPAIPPEILCATHRSCDGLRVSRTCRKINCCILNIPLKERNGIILDFNTTLTQNGSSLSFISNKTCINHEVDVRFDIKIHISAMTSVGSSPVRVKVLPGEATNVFKNSIPKLWADENKEGTEITIGWLKTELIASSSLVYCTNYSNCQKEKFVYINDSSDTKYIWRKPNPSLQYYLAVVFEKEKFTLMTEWMCIYKFKIPPKVLIKQVTSEPSSTNATILIEWIRNSCVNYCGLRIQHYIIQLCPVDRGDELCENTILNNTSTRYRITNLKPFSFYEMLMFATSKAGKSPESETRRIKTLEGRPSSPYDLKLIKTTGSSVLIEFESPKIPNGIMQEYITYIYFDSGNLTNQTSDGNRTLVHIKNLEGNKNYSFQIRGKNGSPFLSDYSEMINTTTKIRAASKLLASQITLTEINKESITVRWEDPIFKNGPISAYQLNWNGSFNGSETVQIPNHSTKIKIPTKVKNLNLNVSVRCITRYNGTEFYSEPSEIVTFTALYRTIPEKKNDLLAKTIGGTIGVGCLLLVYLIFRNRRVCKPYREVR